MFDFRSKDQDLVKPVKPKFTPKLREVLEGHAPFELCYDGVIQDCNGVGLWSCQLPLTDVDKALVACLNDAVKTK